PELARRVWDVLGGLSLVAVTAMALGQFVAIRVARRREAMAARRDFAWATRIVNALSLTVFAWIIHGLDWPRVVNTGFGLRDAILADEALILAPYLLAQLVGWL